MASLPPGSCCTVGVKHEVTTPTGKAIHIAGKWNGYYAAPPESCKAHKETAILYIPDVLGIWQNSQLAADRFAANGYHTLIVDTLNGDALSPNRPEGFDMKKWMMEGSDGKNPHTPDAIDPIVEAAISFLKEKHGIKKIGAVGYCLGAKYVLRHYKTGIDVGFIAHPSNTTEEELAAITGPLSIAAAEKDYLFPPEKRHESERILTERGLPFQVTLYSGVSHGFAVRGDLSKRFEVFSMERAFFQAVEWFNEYLL